MVSGVINLESRYTSADTDEAGHAFQSEAGHPFRFEAGQVSDVMSATVAVRSRGSY